MTTVDVNLDVMLSVVHNRIVCDFAEYRAFLNAMTRADVPLWEVDRARVLVADKLNKDCPELVRHRPPEKTDSGNAKKWVKSVGKLVGYDAAEVNPLRTAMKVRTLSVALS